MNYLIQKYGNEKRWVHWRLEERDGKKTKLPVNPHNGKLASSTDPGTWNTYEYCAERDDSIGIVLTPARTLLGIDIDHCLTNGSIDHLHEKEILSLLNAANSYTEISPSGTGLHILIALSEPLSLEANRHGNFECYTEGRYFTFTGVPFAIESPVRTITASEAKELLGIIGYPWSKNIISDIRDEHKKIATDLSEGVRSLLDVPEAAWILKKMFNASNGAEIKKLHDGDITPYGTDVSRADMALLSHLAFWTGRDAARMDEIWLASPLGQREKTQKRKDYRDRSIKSAINRCKDVYDPDKHFGESEVDIDDLGLLYMLKDKRKIYYKNTENMTRVIQKHPDFIDTLRFDAYHNIIQRKVNDTWRDLEDRDSVYIQTRISVLFSDFAHVGKEMVYDAIVKVAYDNIIDSGKDYIESLKWDETPRLDTWLHQAFNTPSDEYHRTVGANWLKGLVKRVIQPGCKFDYVLVLEGKQGIKKSTSLGVLAGPLGHAETTISTEQKDFFLLMQGNAIIEFSEGETLSRTEVKQLKAVITTPVDKFRQPYGRAVVPHPRRCVFAMTTNQSEYLKDETGNRRWLPVAVSGVANIEWIEQNREQLFAEAYQRVIVGSESTYEFPAEELEEQQTLRRIKDPNIDVIVNWYWKQSPFLREQGITVTDVYVNALHGGFMTKPLSRNDEMSISDVLRTWLKLESRRMMTGGSRSYRYFSTDKTVLLMPSDDMSIPADSMF